MHTLYSIRRTIGGVRQTGATSFTPSPQPSCPPSQTHCETVGFPPETNQDWKDHRDKTSNVASGERQQGKKPPMIDLFLLHNQYMLMVQYKKTVDLSPHQGYQNCWYFFLTTVIKTISLSHQLLKWLTFLIIICYTNGDLTFLMAVANQTFHTDIKGDCTLPDKVSPIIYSQWKVKNKNEINFFLLLPPIYLCMKVKYYFTCTWHYNY